MFSNSLTKGWLIALSILTANSQSLATPTIYPTQTSWLSSLKNGTNSNLVADDQDQRKFYVMPPNTAIAKSQGLHTINTNIGFCGEMKSVQNYSKRILEKINELEKEDLNTRSRLGATKAKIRKARIDVADFLATNNLVVIAQWDTRIAAIDGRLDQLYPILEKCSDHCESHLKEVNDLQKERKEIADSKLKLQRENVKLIRIYEQEKEKLKLLTEEFKEEEEVYFKLQEKLFALKDNQYKIYEKFSNLEGARAAFLYASSWDQNIEALRADNPGFSFEKIHTKNAKVSSSLISVRSPVPGRAIMYFELPGTTSNNGTLDFPSYPESLSGNVVLSLAGVCPIVKPDDFGVDALPSALDMKYGLTIVYEFPTSFRLSVKAKYDMHKMYQKVVSSGSSGGFFSSRSWTDVSENTEFKDSFVVNWKEQDPSNSISIEEKVKIEQELKTDIFTRMLLYATPDAKDKSAILALVAPPANGAVVLAGQLSSICPGNIYCQAGAAITNVLNAIFGSSSAVSSYTQTQNFELESEYSRDKVTYIPWVTSYIHNN